MLKDVPTIDTKFESKAVQQRPFIKNSAYFCAHEEVNSLDTLKAPQQDFTSCQLDAKAPLELSPSQRADVII